VNRHEAARNAQRGSQLFERCIRRLLNELVELPHLRIVQCGRIVPPRQWRGASGLLIALQPPLKGRNVNAIEFGHLRLSATSRLVGRNGPLSNFSACYSHVSIIENNVSQVNLKML
jgi:hypothetical protein